MGLMDEKAVVPLKGEALEVGDWILFAPASACFIGKTIVEVQPATHFRGCAFVQITNIYTDAFGKRSVEFVFDNRVKLINVNAETSVVIIATELPANTKRED
jgi:hypothetical protein